MQDLTESDIERFWSRIDKRGAEECWPWTGRLSSTGYGVIKHRSGSNIVASRIACFLEYGEDKGRYALHSCDNPPCCNPKHLRWGTNKDNVADAISRGRKTPPPRNSHYRTFATQPKGENVWNQTLCEEQVREIWRLHLSGCNISKIAKEVSAKVHAVQDVCRGRSWRHLPDAPTLETLKTGGVRRGFNQHS